MSTEHEAPEHAGQTGASDEAKATTGEGTSGAAGGDAPGEAAGTGAADERPDAGAEAAAAPGEDAGDGGGDAEAAEPDDAGATAGAGADADGGDGIGSIKRIIEAALLVAGRPLAMGDLEKLFGGRGEAPGRNALRRALAQLDADWAGGCLELQEVATGYRAQVRNEYEPWIARLWDEKPPRYSRALLETLAIIAYRQPMTRSEIEEIRGVTVSSQIIRTLTEREWIRVVGHRETPGRPAMYGTTREFLDYFNLKTLDQLPPISDIRDLEGNYPELGFEAEPAGPSSGGEGAAGGATPGADAPGEGEAGDPAASASASDANDGARPPEGADAAEDTEVETPDDDSAGAGDPDAAPADDEEDPPCTPVS